MSTVTGQHHVEHVMGMAVSIDLRDDDISSAALPAVVAWLHHVDSTFSTYIEDSPISRIGRGELAIGDAGDEIGEVLDLCEQLRDLSGGAFDITAVPAPNGTHFDPSGLVKGWSVERAGEILSGFGAENFCINAGGDIVLRGGPAPLAPWRIGIRHPDEIDKVAAVVSSRGPLAIATSATYERGAHIIDPSTGEPTTELASVTIVGPDLTMVDGFATAAFVMGLDGLLWVAERSGYGGFAITRDGHTYSTPVFDSYRVPADA
jgi:thiamine biosynthesis lipoprotein